jgi:hypothetical protein
MNLILMQAGYPPVVIRLDNRPEYYLALAPADAGNLDNFIALVGNLLIHSLQLFLRGAKGEPIEESTDLDKKLALLQRQLADDVTARQEKTLERLNLLFAVFLEPFLYHLLTQLAKFDRFFTRATVTPDLSDNGLEWYIKRRWDIALAYEWEDFIKDEELRLSFWLRIRLEKFSFEISYGIDNESVRKPYPFEMPEFFEMLTYKGQKLLLRSSYSGIYPEKEIPTLIQLITDEIYATVEKFATK